MLQQVSQLNKKKGKKEPQRQRRIKLLNNLNKEQEIKKAKNL